MMARSVVRRISKCYINCKKTFINSFQLVFLLYKQLDQLVWKFTLFNYGSDRVTDSHHVHCHVFVSSHINFSDLCNGLPEMFSVFLLIS